MHSLLIEIVVVCTLAYYSEAFSPPFSFNPDMRLVRSSTALFGAVVEQKVPIKIGVIGCGRIGVVHLGACSKVPGVKVMVVSNPTVSKAEKAAKEFNVPKFTSSAEEVITDPTIDAVWICSPSNKHAEQIKLAAANGKHVFCEKPIATNLPETVEAINACNEAGVKLMIGLQRRFDPNFLRVKEAIEKNEVGDTVVVKVCSRDPAPPPIEYVKGGGGIFCDMAVHDLDMTRFLINDDPLEILAVGSTHIDRSILSLDEPSERYDTACAIVKYPGGKQGILDVCRQSSYGYDQRAEVLGTKGMILTENMYPSTAKIFKTDFTGNADMPYDFFLERYNEAYVRETIAFCECLVNNGDVPCTGQDGLIALVMSIAAGMSAEENRWVKFSEVIEKVFCDEAGNSCMTLGFSDAIPEGFKPTEKIEDLIKESGPKESKFGRLWKNLVAAN